MTSEDGPMTWAKALDLIEWELEMHRHCNRLLEQLGAMTEAPDTGYRSTLQGLRESYAAFFWFPPCAWWLTDTAP